MPIARFQILKNQPTTNDRALATENVRMFQETQTSSSFIIHLVSM